MGQDPRKPGKRRRVDKNDQDRQEMYVKMGISAPHGKMKQMTPNRNNQEADNGTERLKTTSELQEYSGNGRNSGKQGDPGKIKRLIVHWPRKGK